MHQLGCSGILTKLMGLIGIVLPNCISLSSMAANIGPSKDKSLHSPCMHASMSSKLVICSVDSPSHWTGCVSANTDAMPYGLKPVFPSTHHESDQNPCHRKHITLCSAEGLRSLFLAKEVAQARYQTVRAAILIFCLTKTEEADEGRKEKGES